MAKGTHDGSAPGRSPLAWAFYDWANSAFATTVVAGFFPAFFKDYWSTDLAPTVSTFWLGVALTTAGLLVAVSAPLLGGRADRRGSRKRMLLFFAAVGIAATVALSLTGRGLWVHALVLYVLAYGAWLLSVVFYDALLPAVSDARTVDRVSSLGYALGYLGGGVLFALNALWVMKPGWFGFAGPAQAVKASFVSVAIWWAAFSLPLVLRVAEPPRAEGVADSSRGVRSAFREARRTPGVLGFLLAYWLYIDGVDTIVTMAVDFGKAIGIGTSDLMLALLMVQFVAFPAAWAFGRAGERFGPRRMILAGLGVYVVIALGASAISKEPWNLLGVRVQGFYVLAFLVGLVQGGVQALSRSFFARLVPPGREATLFGFYNMVGKFAAIIGPILLGSVARATGSPRAGIASVVVLFVAGAALLLRVRTDAQAMRA